MNTRSATVGDPVIEITDLVTHYGEKTILEGIS